MTEDYLESFNPPQREAVEYCDGPALVIAGAGSGKTRVLTYKIAYLIEQHGYEPWSILALTFTNKAAGEMKERIAKIVGLDTARRLWMGTFHSIFLRILRVEHEAIGFDKNFTIYDSDDSKSLVKKIIKQMNLDDKIYKPGTILNGISNCKNQLVTAQEYASNPANLQSDDRAKIGDFYKIYLNYSNRCRQSNAMDFDDILLYTYQLFDKNPEILEKWESRFNYVLVDEYQDTNHAQHRIVWQLTKNHQRVCVVGDDAQSIYSFRGANIENILSFNKIYTNSKLIKLEQNYRSTQNIVEAANSLIGKNNRQIKKNVFSENDKGDKLHLIATNSDIEESKVVVNSIRSVKAKENCHYSDFAILYRTNAQSRSFEEALIRERIPYRIYGGLSFYQRKEVKDVLAYFKLTVNLSDEEAFRRIINTPKRGIGATTIAKIANIATDEKNNVSLWQVISFPEQYGLSLSNATFSKIIEFKELIENFNERSFTENAAELGLDIIKKSGIMEEIFKEEGPDGHAKQEILEELINGIQDFCNTRTEEGESCTLNDYLSEVSLMSDLDSDDDAEEKDKITLMTIHSAKGLEFNTVFVVGLEEGLFPNEMASGKPREMEEERRLFYVAITRAKSHCYLTYAQTRYRYGQQEFCSPSRFLMDIDSCYIDRKQTMHTSRRTTSYDDIDLPWKKRSSIYDDDYRSTSYKPSSDGRSFSSYDSQRSGSSQPAISQNSFISSSRPFSPSTPKKKTHIDGMSNITKIVTPKSENKATTSSQPSAICFSYQGIAVGKHIMHERFGRGEVIKLEGHDDSLKAFIKFDNLGTKQLLLKFAKFTIID